MRVRMCMVIVDCIGLGQWVSGLGWIGSNKMDPCPTLVEPVTGNELSNAAWRHMSSPPVCRVVQPIYTRNCSICRIKEPSHPIKRPFTLCPCRSGYSPETYGFALPSSFQFGWEWDEITPVQLVPCGHGGRTWLNRDCTDLRNSSWS